MNDIIKKVKDIFKKTFSSRKLEWQRQSEFINALAEANDICFDARKFPRPKRHLKNGRIVWEQSRAAEYISEKIYEKEMLGEYIFKPWNASWLPLRKAEIYDTMPYFCIPIKDTPKRKAGEGKVWAFVFSKHTRQEQWMDLEDFNAMAICKDCMFKWEHYSLICQREGHTNLDDIVVKTNPDGTIERFFKCPQCGGTKIYQDAHWGTKDHVTRGDRYQKE